MPRLRRYGEAVDDHQVHFAQRLAERDLVTMADPENLAEVLAGVRAGDSGVSIAADERLVGDLRRVIATVLDRPTTGLSASVGAK